MKKSHRYLSDHHDPELPPSQLKKYSITLNGRRTSIRMEPQFMAVLKEMTNGTSLNALLTNLPRQPGLNLAATARLAVLDYVKALASPRLRKVDTKP